MILLCRQFFPLLLTSSPRTFMPLDIKNDSLDSCSDNVKLFIVIKIIYETSLNNVSEGRSKIFENIPILEILNKVEQYLMSLGNHV